MSQTSPDTRFQFYCALIDDPGGSWISLAKPEEGEERLVPSAKKNLKRIQELIEKYDKDKLSLLPSITFLYISKKSLEGDRISQDRKKKLLDNLHGQSGREPIEQDSGEVPEYPPIIAIVDDEIMDTYPDKGTKGKKMLTIEQKTEVNYLKSQEKFTRTIDPRYRFWDSSIYHRTYSLNPKSTQEARFHNLLDEYTKLTPLFDTVIGVEFLDFQLRKLGNSYFPELGSDQGHSKDVTPYQFHSESLMKRKADELQDKLQGYTWGCLLIDDFYQKPLRLVENRPTKTEDPSSENDGDQQDEELTNTTDEKQERLPDNKTDWICKLINEHSDGTSLDSPIIKILNKEEEDPRENYLEKGKQWMNEYPMADIILLDYFFNEGSQLANGGENTAEKYGHKLLKSLLESYKGQDGTGLSNTKPFGRHWIFPISVFDHAFESHVRNMGENEIEQYMVIANTVDPINTPQLFRYQFYSFLQRQKSMIDIRDFRFMTRLLACGLEEDVVGAFHQVYPEISSQTTLLQKLRDKSGNHIQSGKEESSIKQNDGKRYSLIAKTVYEKNYDQETVAYFILVHLEHLGYLIRYSSGNQWAVMWEECTNLKTLIQIQMKNRMVDEEEYKRFFKAIEDYITKLAKPYIS
ncbi:MAG: hypothetical protein AAFP89_26115 [Bacteroidota bacterium]